MIPLFKIEGEKKKRHWLSKSTSNTRNTHSTKAISRNNRRGDWCNADIVIEPKIGAISVEIAIQRLKLGKVYSESKVNRSAIIPRNYLIILSTALGGTGLCRIGGRCGRVVCINSRRRNNTNGWCRPCTAGGVQTNTLAIRYTVTTSLNVGVPCQELSFGDVVGGVRGELGERCTSKSQNFSNSVSFFRKSTYTEEIFVITRLEIPKQWLSDKVEVSRQEYRYSNQSPLSPDGHLP